MSALLSHHRFLAGWTALCLLGALAWSIVSLAA